MHACVYHVVMFCVRVFFCVCLYVLACMSVCVCMCLVSVWCIFTVINILGKICYFLFLNFKETAMMINCIESQVSHSPLFT